MHTGGKIALLRNTIGVKVYGNDEKSVDEGKMCVLIYFEYVLKLRRSNLK